MARRLSEEEEDRIRELDQNRASDKEIADIVCREFNRETRDRSTIHRVPQRPRGHLPLV